MRTRMPEAMADKTLLLLLDEVRQKTLSELSGLDELHSRWTPPNLRNSCLWHAGHAYVVTEFLTMKALGRSPDLPDSWMKTFSWESNPAHIPADRWPHIDEVVAELQRQHVRLRGILAELTPEQLDAPEPGNPERTVRFAILRGLHDEARHSGEVNLLRKMMRKSFIIGDAR
ncbi:MAG: DinB family protein [Isosphaeraceae bacterium]